MNNLSEPTLWGIVLALTTVVVWGGKRIVHKLDECEKDRELLNRKITVVAVKCSAATGVEINVDHVS